MDGCPDGGSTLPSEVSRSTARRWLSDFLSESVGVRARDPREWNRGTWIQATVLEVQQNSLRSALAVPLICRGTPLRCLPHRRLRVVVRSLGGGRPQDWDMLSAPGSRMPLPSPLRTTWVFGRTQCGVDIVDTRGRRKNEAMSTEEYLRYFTDHFTEEEWGAIRG